MDDLHLCIHIFNHLYIVYLKRCDMIYINHGEMSEMKLRHGFRVSGRNGPPGASKTSNGAVE